MNKLYKFMRILRSFFLLHNNYRIGKKKYQQYITSPSICLENKKGIVVVLHEAKLGGAPLLGMNLVKEFIDMGYQVDIVVLRYGPMIPKLSELAPIQVCVYRKELNKLVLNLNQVGYSTVICNSVATGWTIPSFKEHNFKIISMIHELPGVIRYLRAEKSLFEMRRSSDKIVLPASYVKNTIEDEFGAFNAKVQVCHQGLYALPTLTYDKKLVRKEVSKVYGFDETKPLYINVATINERKGFDLFANMAKQDSEGVYLWIGDGIDSSFGRKTLKALGEYPKNLIMPGYISNREMMTKIYAAATVLLLTSREEPFGSVVLEAFANKTPVIAFEGCGGYIDVIIPEKTGDLVEPFNINEMIRKAHLINTYENKYNTIIHNCFKVANESSFSKYCLNILDN